MKRWTWTVVVIGVLIVFTLFLGRKVIEMVSVNLALMKKIARAFGRAEGWFVADSRPARNNNPGNLTKDLTGKGVGVDGKTSTFPGYIIYATAADGWDALEKQIRIMFSGKSRYNPDMTILQVANLWTTTEQVPWAQNVARALGVDVSTKLKDIKPDMEV